MRCDAMRRGKFSRTLSWPFGIVGCDGIGGGGIAGTRLPDIKDVGLSEEGISWVEDFQR